MSRNGRLGTGNARWMGRLVRWATVSLSSKTLRRPLTQTPIVLGVRRSGPWWMGEGKHLGLQRFIFPKRNLTRAPRSEGPMLDEAWSRCALWHGPLGSPQVDISPGSRGPRGRTTTRLHTSIHRHSIMPACWCQVCWYTIWPCCLMVSRMTALVVARGNRVSSLRVRKDLISRKSSCHWRGTLLPTAGTSDCC